MKNKYLIDFVVNDMIENENFALVNVKKNMTKSGSDYYRVELSDKSGSVVANIWSDNIKNCDEENLKEGQIVTIYAKVEEFKGVKQLNILSLKICDDYDINDFATSSDVPVEELWTMLQTHIESIEDENIKNLVLKIFAHDNISEKFKVAPAAEKIHHAFNGGLIEHVLEMLEMADSLFKFYPEVDQSLVKAGIILHDIGKIYEIENKQISYSKSREGILLGHIIIGFDLICKQAPSNFPEDLLLKLKHIILAHHGLLEYGSPVMPMTIEAVFVNKMDDASAHIRQYQRILRENKANPNEFSERDYILGTKILLN